MASGDEFRAAIALAVLDNLLEGCQVIDFDFRYLYVNNAVVSQGRMSREDLVGRTMMECYPGIEQTPMFAQLQRCMQERKHGRLENEFTFPDGSQGWFELRFMPVPEGVCILSLDITGAKHAAAALARTEAQFRHAQKMEAVGRLAGGVAHDFNNLLSVIGSYATIVLGDLGEDDPMRADVAEIKLASERASSLTRQLLTFSRRQPAEPQILDLNEVIGAMEGMLRRLLGEDVQVRFAAASDLGRVRVNRGHMEQVLMNLAVNARDAMPDGGSLTIETQNVHLDEGYAAEHLGIEPGPHVVVAVSDTGVGMDAKLQERIFEPFFTTKGSGKGTGLGLSTVFGIVEQSGGRIWVYSEPGRGTTFKLYFPRSEGMAFAAASAERVASLRGSEKILLVEDDDQVRRVVRGILVVNGYEVLEAGSGDEALRISDKHEAPIDLLLTDVIMPRMNGKKLAESLLATRPDVRVLYMSGYTDDAMVEHDLLNQRVALLEKPITPGSLLRKVRAALDAPSNAP